MFAAHLGNAGRDKSNYLPITSLLRLARRLGLENVRYVEALSRPEGPTLYRLGVTVRNEVCRQRQHRRQRIEHKLRLEDFGRYVLELERQGLRRWAALRQAGQRAKLPGSSRRYLEQKFREFEAISSVRGYIRNLSIGSKLPPRFGLADLKARKGRSRKNAHFRGDFLAENCLVFPPFKR